MLDVVHQLCTADVQLCKVVQHTATNADCSDIGPVNCTLPQMINRDEFDCWLAAHMGGDACSLCRHHTKHIKQYKEMHGHKQMKAQHNP